MIDLQFNGAMEIQARMEQLAPSMLERAADAIARIDVDLARFIVFQKLDGQVLHRRTGRLADSIEIFPAVAVDGVATGGVFQNTERASYGPSHEFGADIPERFGSPFMRFEIGGSIIYAARARGYRLIPRPFMFPSAEEFYPVYEDAMRRLIAESLTEWQGVSE